MTASPHSLTADAASPESAGVPPYPQPLDQRILVLAPLGNDAALTAGFLDRAGLTTSICLSMTAVAAAARVGCGVLVVAEEALNPTAVAELKAMLAEQPEWSELPLCIVAGGQMPPQRSRHLSTIAPGTNVTIIERPFHPETLISMVQAALRSRRRQYQVRDLVQNIHVSETRLQNILGSITDAFVSLDTAWRFTYINDAYMELVSPLFSSRDELVGHSLWEKFPGLEKLEAGQRYLRAMETQQPDSFEVFYEPLDAWIEVRVFPTPDVFSIYSRNITRRKRTEQALADAQERLAATLVAAEIGTWTWDIESNHVMADKNLARLFSRDGEGAGELSIDSFVSAIHPRDRERVGKVISAAIQRPNGEYETDCRLVQRDGSVRWVTARGRVQCDADGKPVRFPGVIIDITERKLVEQALRESEVRFRATFNQAATLLYLLDPRGRVTDVNDSAISAARLPNHKEEIGRFFWETTWWNRCPIVQGALRDAVNAASHGHAGHFESTYFTRDGEERWTELYLTPVKDGGRLVFILAEGHDITELKQARRAVETARDVAENASRAKDDFLASLSHELRTPLNPVLLIASDAARDESLPEEVRRDFDAIRKNVNLEARLIDDLLDLTLITRGKMALDMAAQDVMPILQDAIDNVRTELDQKHLRLSVHVKDGGPRTVWGDAVRLQQIFWNVLKNAVKFTPDGGAIQIDAHAESTAKEYHIRVTDTGIGMTSLELDRAFKSFTQGDHAEQGGPHRFGGLGLGLAICRLLVELHSGRIRAFSDGPGQGTSFEIALPLADPAQLLRAKPPPPAQPLRPPVHAPASMRILLVEDHEPTRTTLQRLLSRRLYRVATAACLAEARELAAHQTFDLVISDIGLPDGSGNDLMAELRDRYGLRGIAMTGYGMEDDIALTQSSGFFHHLTKPVTVQSLEAALNAAAGGPSGIKS